MAVKALKGWLNSSGQDILLKAGEKVFLLTFASPRLRERLLEHYRLQPWASIRIAGSHVPCPVRQRFLVERVDG